MNDETFEYLSNFEHNFDTLINSSYSTSIPYKDTILLHEIYNKLNPNAQSVNMNCSKCLGNMLRYIGIKYFEEKKRREEEQNKQTTESQVEEKPKKTRKPRTTKTKE